MRTVAFLLLTLLTVGCASTHHERAQAVPPYQVRNVYKAPLPDGFRRVVLLPIVASPELGVPESVDGVKDSIVEELGKTKNFELLQISGDRLYEICGVRSLTSTDVWPDKLREALKERQVDGVMLVELTHLKGYAPLSLGIKARLVGLNDGVTLWACDELFDCTEPTVFSGAKNYEKGMLLEVGKAKSPGTIEFSPARFAKYVGYMVFYTLPIEK